MIVTISETPSHFTGSGWPGATRLPGRTALCKKNNTHCSDSHCVTMFCQVCGGGFLSESLFLVDSVKDSCGERADSISIFKKEHSEELP